MLLERYICVQRTQYSVHQCNNAMRGGHCWICFRFSSWFS
uniref:Uncharacterized protein n=1 Tax=Arundo donax TaxID=35708 RepID=A0A0A9ECC3_ARUDO